MLMKFESLDRRQEFLRFRFKPQLMFLREHWNWFPRLMFQRLWLVFLHFRYRFPYEWLLFHYQPLFRECRWRMFQLLSLMMFNSLEPLREPKPQLKLFRWLWQDNYRLFLRRFLLFQRGFNLLEFLRQFFLEQLLFLQALRLRMFFRLLFHFRLKLLRQRRRFRDDRLLFRWRLVKCLLEFREQLRFLVEPKFRLQFHLLFFLRFLRFFLYLFLQFLRFFLYFFLQFLRFLLQFLWRFLRFIKLNLIFWYLCF